MKALAITLKGIENISAREIEELIKAKTEVRESAVIFDFKKHEELFLLCYKGQSIAGIMQLFFEFETSNLKNSLATFEKKIAAVDFKEWTGKETTFRVTCNRIGTHDFSSQDFAKEAGGIILKKTSAKVDLTDPQIIFYIFISGEKGYFGIDFAGFELAKREYNIFSHPSAISPCLAYAIMRMSGYDRKKTFIDVFAKSGLIPLEAAIYATGIAVNHYRKDKFAFLTLKPFEKFNFEKFFSAVDKKATLTKTKIYCVDSIIANVRAAEKNAKIAGVNKAINFSRMDVSWLDTKYKKHQLTYAASFYSLPQDNESEKIGKEFFYQMEYLLEKKGRIALMTRHSEPLEKFAAAYKFKLIEKMEIVRGSEKNAILIFEKE